MEWTQLWAGITFAAQNGDAEGLLTAAAAGGLHLSDIVPRPGGFSARCAAWHYRKLAALARRRRVRLHIQNGRVFSFASVPFSGGGDSGPDALSFSLCCSGCRALSGSSNRWA